MRTVFTTKSYRSTEHMIVNTKKYFDEKSVCSNIHTKQV